MTGDEMRDQLAAALPGWILAGFRDDVADALLPTVRKIAADELRAAAEDLIDRVGPGSWERLRARAAALDPS